jgi:threonylcarbamoyladenosine tRNA methylthiotransferase MtaB
MSIIFLKLFSEYVISWEDNMTFNVITLGCKVNSCESAAIERSFAQNGFEPAKDGETGDICIINSCAVTGMSEKKARQIISHCKKDNPDCVVVLCGCYPQAYPETASAVEGADIVTGNSAKSEIPSMVRKFLGSRTRTMKVEQLDRSFDEASADADLDRTRAFIKIEDGCDRFCSYCIIPTARGRVRSRKPDEITKQALLCAESGHKEIVLTGINLGCYGQEYGLTLGDAVKAADVEGIERIRLGSLEPEMITDSEIEKFKAVQKLCPHFHLSLQSGCDETLKRMCRRYDTAQYEAVVDKLRAAFPDCSITTDIMVGFAGETDEEFAKSMAFAEKIGFAKIHVFPYSIRKGTVAAERADQVVPQIRTQRAKKMEELGKRLECEFWRSQVGRVHTVLIEKRRSEDYCGGFTASYIPVRIYGKDIERHSLVQVEITAAREDYCLGRLV